MLPGRRLHRPQPPLLHGRAAAGPPPLMLLFKLLPPGARGTLLGRLDDFSESQNLKCDTNAMSVHRDCHGGQCQLESEL